MDREASSVSLSSLRHFDRLKKETKIVSCI